MQFFAQSRADWRRFLKVQQLQLLSQNILWGITPKSGKNKDHPKLRQFFRLKIEELTLHYHAIVAVFLYVLLRATDL